MLWITVREGKVLKLPMDFSSIASIMNQISSIWVFPKIGVPQNGWFIIRENPIKIDDLRVPLFLETPICLMETWFNTFSMMFSDGCIFQVAHGTYGRSGPSKRLGPPNHVQCH